MFEAFQPRADRTARRRLALSTGASIAVYAAMIGALVLFAAEAETAVEEPPIDVTFRPPPPPAPPPAPPVVVPPAVKTKRVDKPRPVEPQVAPKVVPVEKAPEAEPSKLEIEVPSGPTGPGGARPAAEREPEAPPPPPPPPPPSPPPARKEPVNLPENATPPVAAEDNAAPEYPAEARANGLEGQVILKVVVTEKGEVARIEVLRGEEPFVGAAIAAVRTWRYQPALVDGVATPVFRIIKVPFRIK